MSMYYIILFPLSFSFIDMTIPPPQSSFEIKASMTKCLKHAPRCECPSSFKCNSSVSSLEVRTKQFRSKCEQFADDHLLRNCDKKISLTLKITNTGFTCTRPQYIVVDHVTDPTNQDLKLKLLNPYVLKIRQRQVYQVYDLVYLNVVNSGPTERVINKDQEGWSGCKTETEQPTCGSVNFNNQQIPYSTGFCCPCLDNDDVGKLTTNDWTDLLNSPTKFCNNLDNSNVGSLSPNFDFQRLRRSIVRQIRGGQNCNDPYTPINLDPKAYHSSAHCLEFSDLWYSVYKIQPPQISHHLQIDIYEKVGMGQQKYQWRRLIKNSRILLGTTRQRWSTRDVLAYYTEFQDQQVVGAFAKEHLLLIPETTGKNVNDYPEIAGGPEEYLVVKTDEVDLSGKSCNKAGVGYDGFVNQPVKCKQERGTCLHNQPKMMWQHDHDLYNQTGCYFLKYYGLLPNNPVASKKCNKTTQDKQLFMYNLGTTISTIQLNFQANSNSMLESNLAIIPEAYTESTQKRIKIIAKVMNSALVPTIFSVSISGCPMEIPASFNSIKSQPVLIPPQHLHTFNLEIYCELPQIDKFYCSLEVVNLKEQLIAVRRILFRNFDRCLCVFYCQCQTFPWLKCRPLGVDQFHAAGYQNGLPVPMQAITFSTFDDSLSVILHIFLYFILTLLYMGLCKAMIGCCVPSISQWGLDKIVSVDIVTTAQFALNVIFFFIIPFAIVWTYLKKLCTAKKYDMFDTDLDICQCRVSQITLMNKQGVQKQQSQLNSTNLSQNNPMATKKK